MSLVEERPIRTKMFDSGILTNRDGEIVLNALQQDLNIIRNEYADGTMDFWAQPQAGGEPRRIIERFDPKTMEPRCRHCGEPL